MSAVDEEPAGGVDADLVQQLVEEHDVAAPLRHLRRLALPGQVDELVEEHLHAPRVVAEHARDHLVPASDALVVGAEHVDHAVEAALQLVAEVGDVRSLVGGEPAALLRAEQHPVLVVAVLRRSHVDRSVGLVRGQLPEQLGQLALELALARPAVEVDPEPLERALDLLQHVRNGVAVEQRELLDVRTAVTVLRRFLATPCGLDGGSELLHLGAGVVVVVLPLDGVSGELAEPRHAVAVRAVPRRRHRDRPGRVRRHHLDLDTL